MLAIGEKFSLFPSFFSLPHLQLQSGLVAMRATYVILRSQRWPAWPA
ncbi:MAG: hypothetical protein ACKOZT_08770 [Cyanobium sp.]